MHVCQYGWMDACVCVRTYVQMCAFVVPGQGGTCCACPMCAHIWCAAVRAQVMRDSEGFLSNEVLAHQERLFTQGMEELCGQAAT